MSANQPGPPRIAFGPLLSPDAAPAQPVARAWPFQRSPGEVANALTDALNVFGQMLPAVRNVFIENAEPLYAAPPAAQPVAQWRHADGGIYTVLSLNAMWKNPVTQEWDAPYVVYRGQDAQLYVRNKVAFDRRFTRLPDAAPASQSRAQPAAQAQEPERDNMFRPWRQQEAQQVERLTRERDTYWFKYQNEAEAIIERLTQRVNGYQASRDWAIERLAKALAIEPDKVRAVEYYAEQAAATIERQAKVIAAADADAELGRAEFARLRLLIQQLINAGDRVKRQLPNGIDERSHTGQIVKEWNDTALAARASSGRAVVRNRFVRCPECGAEPVHAALCSSASPAGALTDQPT